MARGSGWWGQRRRHSEAARQTRVREDVLKREARRRKPREVLHFDSQRDYDKWVSHVKIHHLERPHPRGDYPEIVIAGKVHKVQHER